MFMNLPYYRIMPPCIDDTECILFGYLLQHSEGNISPVTAQQAVLRIRLTVKTF